MNPSSLHTALAKAKVDDLRRAAAGRGTTRPRPESRWHVWVKRRMTLRAGSTPDDEALAAEASSQTARLPTA
jgi:hypothetical protein